MPAVTPSQIVSDKILYEFRWATVRFRVDVRLRKIVLCCVHEPKHLSQVFSGSEWPFFFPGPRTLIVLYIAGCVMPYGNIGVRSY